MANRKQRVTVIKKTCVKEHIDTLTKTNGDLWGAN